MKETGIVRRIDELGRVVIPKEIRKTLHLSCGDSLEIWIQADTVMFKKYSPMRSVMTFGAELVSSVQEVSDKNCILCDLEKILCASRKISRDYEDKTLNEKFLKEISSGKSFMYNRADGGTCLPIMDKDNGIYSCQAVYPIISEGKTVGAFAIFDFADNKKVDGADLGLCSLGARFISRSLEQ